MTTTRRGIAEECAALRALHVPGDPVILPNAWDVSSARVVADAGFPAVATSSGAVAESLGYEDHELAPVDEMLAAAARIVRSVEVPVTVDAESGYGLPAADLVAALHAAGAAGCNLEDTHHSSGTLRAPDEAAARLAAVRRAADAISYPLVVNARIDVFLAERGRPQGELLPAAIDRARWYLDAGADCVYPILLAEEDAIGSFVAAVAAPVNVLALPHAPPVGRLAEIGVARVSWGTLLYQQARERLAAMVGALRGPRK